jgi:hypothetical protein
MDCWPGTGVHKLSRVVIACYGQPGSATCVPWGLTVLPSKHNPPLLCAPPSDDPQCYGNESRLVDCVPSYAFNRISTTCAELWCARRNTSLGLAARATPAVACVLCHSLQNPLTRRAHRQVGMTCWPSASSVVTTPILTSLDSPFGCTDANGTIRCACVGARALFVCCSYVATSADAGCCDRGS